MNLETLRGKRWAIMRMVATNWEKGTGLHGVPAPDTYHSQKYNFRMKKAVLNHICCREIFKFKRENLGFGYNLLFDLGRRAQVKHYFQKEKKLCQQV